METSRSQKGDWNRSQIKQKMCLTIKKYDCFYQHIIYKYFDEKISKNRLKLSPINDSQIGFKLKKLFQLKMINCKIEIFSPHFSLVYLNLSGKML